MKIKLHKFALTALIALAIAGCSNDSVKSTSGGEAAAGGGTITAEAAAGGGTITAVAGTNSLPVNRTWRGGDLWKPKSEARPGPAVLTRSSIPRGTLTLHRADGSVIPTQIEYRGRTNGSRETYFILNLKASDIPRNSKVKIGNNIWLVENPNRRYENLPQ